ncbi:MAG: serine hydrolase [Acidobacteria bacterium 13_1_40CM_3_55_6]|nr:MAG: serine hydrolase [Acidobacteria bacterium 13_1_40CM_3_55_6]
MKIASRTYLNAFALALFCIFTFQAPAFAQDKAGKIDQMLSLFNQYGQFNGAALVADNGKVIYKKGFGLANMEWNIPNTPETKFRLGSITKQFTATLILQLVEQGKIKLDGKLIDYLPDYRKDTGAKVTIHNLLSHTSGIPSYTSLPGFFQNVSRNPFAVNDFIKTYASGDLEFEPGTKFVYSNSGYFLLGAIIEKVAGKPYEQVLKENIFDPLGMKNTGYDHWGSIIGNRATGYSRTPRGYETAPYLDMSIPYAAGSLYSTVEDLYLWDQALYGERVLSAKSKDLMFKPNLSNYGYGFVMTKATLAPPTKLAVPVVQHNGGINGFSTVIVRMLPEKRLIVLLDNSEDGQYLDKMVLELMSVLYDQPYEMPKRSIADALFKTILEKDVASAVKQYREMKAGSSASEYDFGEMELNRLGYRLLSTRKVAEAIEMFKLNVEIFPQASNVYDSLGEAYMLHGDKELAIANYKRSLELDPQNKNATAKLTTLTTERKEVKVDAKVYDSYAGEYQLGPAFTITITSEDGKLMAQATGQPKFELFPSSETDFFLKVVNAQFTFVKDEQGKVTQLILNQDGRKMPAKKIR